MKTFKSQAWVQTLCTRYLHDPAIPKSDLNYYILMCLHLINVIWHFQKLFHQDTKKYNTKYASKMLARFHQHQTLNKTYPVLWHITRHEWAHYYRITVKYLAETWSTWKLQNLRDITGRQSRKVNHLARRKMHEDVENFDTLVYRRDRLKRWHYEVLHHHLEVLDTIAEPGNNRDNLLLSTVKAPSLSTQQPTTCPHRAQTLSLTLSNNLYRLIFWQYTTTVCCTMSTQLQCSLFSVNISTLPAKGPATGYISTLLVTGYISTLLATGPASG